MPDKIAQPLMDYIRQHHGTQRRFAAQQKVHPQQVTVWIKSGYIVVDGIMYSPRRHLRSSK